MQSEAKGRDWLMTGLAAVAIVMAIFAMSKVANISADAAQPYALMAAHAE